MANQLLDNEDTQVKIITILRNTGQYEKAAKGVGVSHKTLERYRKEHKDFSHACDNAREFYKVQQVILYEAAIKRAALAELVKRIQSGTISDTALMKILYDK